MIRAFLFAFLFVAAIATVLNVPCEAKRLRVQSCSGEVVRVKVKRVRAVRYAPVTYAVPVQAKAACGCEPGCAGCAYFGCTQGEPCHCKEAKR